MTDLKRIEGFYRVAQAGGYAKAARSFPYPITAAGVHQQVRKLERELGLTLLLRTGHERVAPTPQGRVLLAYCAPFFEGWPDMLRKLQGGGGVLRIDAAALEIRHFVPGWLRRLRDKHPDIDVELTEIQQPDPERLRTGEADLIVDCQPTLPHDVRSQRVGVHHAFVVWAKRLGTPRKQPMLDWLNNLPFVAFTDGTTHARLQLEGIAAAAGSRPERILRASSTEAILGFVEAGLGFSVVPWPHRSGPGWPGVVARRIRGREGTFPIAASWIDDGAADTMVRAALSALK